MAEHREASGWVRDRLRFLPWPLAVVVFGAFALATYGYSREFTSVRTPAAPLGIVSLELARTPADAEEVVQSWRQRGLIPAARRDVEIDFVFLVLYSTTLALLVSLSARAAVAAGIVDKRRGEMAGAVGVVAMLGAGACDAAENMALLRMLDGSIDSLSVSVSLVSALVKFHLIGIGLTTTLVVLAASAITAVYRVVKWRLRR